MSTINPSGKKIFSVSTKFCGRDLTLEVNRVGFRSTASVLVKYGDTVVLGTTQVGSRPIQLDYFPLSVDYEEKFYAAGKISGSRFIKREGRPSDEAILIGRLIDRPIRPRGYSGWPSDRSPDPPSLSERLSPRSSGGHYRTFDGSSLSSRCNCYDSGIFRFNAKWSSF